METMVKEEDVFVQEKLETTDYEVISPLNSSYSYEQSIEQVACSACTCPGTINH